MYGRWTAGGERGRRAGGGALRVARVALAFALVALAFALVALGSAPGARAQSAATPQVRIQVGDGPHYLGEPIELQVVVSGFDREPAPEVIAPDVDGGRLRAAGISDSSSTSITIVNGQLTRQTEVRLIHRFQLVPDREGRLALPPFVVRQGGAERRTRSVALDVRSVPRTGLVSLALELPEGPIFVGQKTPVGVVLRLDREAQRDLLSLDAAVPLFDVPGLRFLDPPPADADAQLEITTASGTLTLPAHSREVVEEGRRILELRAERTLIPMDARPIEASAPRVVIRRGTRFRRDLFNQRQATAMERLQAVGEPVRLEVLEVPREGRPPSFAGAVGTGFSLEVSADRSVVQVGEPITLTFLLRGDGDLSTAGLPPFDAPGLFDPERFRVPAEPPAGERVDDGKRFEATVRVLAGDVREIPALEYAWFDAGSRRFETTTSRPIALSVGAARVVGADDVTRAVRDETATAADAAAPDGSGARDAMSGAAPRAPGGGTAARPWAGADLAVETDRVRLLAARRARGPSPLIGPAGHLLGLVVLGLAYRDHRRRRRDPRLVAREAALDAAERAVAGARGAEAGEAATLVGRALREWLAAEPDEAGPEVDALLAICDARRFAPPGSSAPEAEDVVARAEALLADRRRALEAEAGGGVRAGVGAIALLLALGALGAVAGIVGLAPVARAADEPLAGAHATSEAEGRAGSATDAVFARLDAALAAYARAQGEPDRDARLAGFAEAERGFAAVIAAGVESVALHTNRGNAALQAGRTGEAVLAYRRALALAPDARQAAQNLAAVRDGLPSWVPRPEPAAGVGAALDPRRLAPTTRSAIAGGAFLAFAFAVLGAVRRPAGAWRGFAALAVGVWGLALASLFPGAGTEGAAGAVVTAEDTWARVSDSALAPRALAAPLPAGVEVERLEARGDWWRVRLANGRQVWLRASSVTPIDG